LWIIALHKYNRFKKPTHKKISNMQAKHTPGPWKVRFMGGKDDGENMFFVEAKNNNKPQLGYGIEILGEDFGDHNGYTRMQRLADAKLIAQAPNLLHALQEIIRHTDHAQLSPLMESVMKQASEVVWVATE
jgi:hypothetical protein